MNWIDKIFPILTLFFGWGLSEYGKYNLEQKNDRKKLKKVIYNLLELRWLLKKDIELEKEILKYFEYFIIKYSKEIGEIDKADSEIVFKKIMPVISENLKNKTDNNLKYGKVEINMDKTIEELSEIDPIFAYKLEGKHQVRKKLNQTENYINDIEKSLINEFSESDLTINNWIKPRLETELIKQLEISILDIAKRINKKTKLEIVKLFKEKKIEENIELNDLIDEFIQKIKNVG
ncbi:hypothetical protein ACXGQW_00940 [Wenyingzhuangia sp. IMCC45533]